MEINNKNFHLLLLSHNEVSRDILPRLGMLFIKFQLFLKFYYY